MSAKIRIAECDPLLLGEVPANKIYIFLDPTDNKLKVKKDDQSLVSLEVSGTGIPKWATTTNYLIDDVVIESNRFYIALTNHTSGVFSTDLNNGDWIQIDSPFNRTEISDSDYIILDSDRLIAYITLTAARTATLPAPTPGVYRSFFIKDETGTASLYPITVDVAGGGTINGLDHIEIRTDNSGVTVYTDGVSYFGLENQRNNGVVKINDGNGLKPTSVFAGGTTGTFLPVEYDHPLTISTSSRWPRNIGTPVDSDIYDDVNDTFIENTVITQPQVWRFICTYSGKPNGQIAGVEFRIRNLLTTFEDTQIVTLPAGRTAGAFNIILETIADAESLPAPWGTGQGYVIDISADKDMTIVVDSVARTSLQAD